MILHLHKHRSVSLLSTLFYHLHPLAVLTCDPQPISFVKVGEMDETPCKMGCGRSSVKTNHLLPEHLILGKEWLQAICWPSCFISSSCLSFDQYCEYYFRILALSSHSVTLHHFSTAWPFRQHKPNIFWKIMASTIHWPTNHSPFTVSDSPWPWAWTNSNSSSTLRSLVLWREDDGVDWRTLAKHDLPKAHWSNI